MGFREQPDWELVLRWARADGQMGKAWRRGWGCIYVLAHRPCECSIPLLLTLHMGSWHHLPSPFLLVTTTLSARFGLEAFHHDSHGP
jgi:hypothetical protein